jgi:site-specific DNA recombinase
MAGMENVTRRAIGIVRVSEVGGRAGDSFASPFEQHHRIKVACERDGLRLVDVLEELDVSGGTPLDKRNGLRQAVEAVEAGRAEVVVAAYFDRLVRSLRVQDELVSRVEAADGQVLAVDVGQVTNGSAGQWLSGTMLGAVAEYQRRTTAERSREAQVRAVARGKWMSPQVPPGYLRGDEGVLVRDPETADAVEEAFARRARGATVAEVRAYLAAHGVELSYAAATRMLKSRAYLGEVHFGDLENLAAHDPLVPLELWRAARRVKPQPGRRAKSERLLARLGILRCGSCGRAMSATTGHRGTWPAYRCSAHPGDDCPRRPTVGAELVERVVVEAVKARLADVVGRASAEQHAREIVAIRDRAQHELDAAIRTLEVVGDEPAARDRLRELAERRDQAQEEVDRLGGTATALSVTAAADWDSLTLAERRDLIVATVERVDIAPGRGAGRVSVKLFGE